jgi:hypothetical protein
MGKVGADVRIMITLAVTLILNPLLTLILTPEPVPLLHQR